MAEEPHTYTNTDPSNLFDINRKLSKSIYESKQILNGQKATVSGIQKRQYCELKDKLNIGEEGGTYRSVIDIQKEYNTVV